eukprot:TRINITY_DN4685_c0_g1_i3.p1 TRINITY_DN4685_c0_g1~~TRINITY_DN4685_c0_g1_i3.p1  ORF type:complete len:136 (+),score=17.66 TRINITY_DN4685_c0_g1_i3:1-408(+)
MKRRTPTEKIKEALTHLNQSHICNVVELETSRKQQHMFCGVSPCYLVRIIFCGMTMHWQMLLDVNNLDFPPDFICYDFTPHISTLSSFRNYNLDDYNCLVKCVQDLFNLFKVILHLATRSSSQILLIKVPLACPH